MANFVTYKNEMNKMSFPVNNSFSIVVNKHIYIRFHTIMYKMTIDSNSLLQYLFFLHEKYGKNYPPTITKKTSPTTELEPKPVVSKSRNNNVKRTLKRKRQASALNNVTTQLTSTRGKNMKTNTVKDGLSIPATEANSEVPNCLEQEPSHCHQIPIVNVVGVKVNAVQNIGTDLSLTNSLGNPVTNLTTINIVKETESFDKSAVPNADVSKDVNQMPPIACRKLKLSINSKTGNLRVCEVDYDCGSLLDNRLTLPPEVDAWKTNTASDIQQSIIDLSDIIRRDTEISTNSTEVNKDISGRGDNNDDSINCTEITDKFQSTIDPVTSPNSAKGVNINTEAHCDKPDTYTDKEASAKNNISFSSQDTQDWAHAESADPIFEISPTKDSIALQRSRRKSKPQKFVSLDDDLTFSDCESFDLDNFDADWLALDDVETSMISPKRDSFTGKTQSDKEEKIFQCLHCDVRFSHSHSLEHHVQVIHQSESRINCEFCRRLFASQFRVDCHLSLNCPKAALEHKCDTCSFRFMTPDELLSHDCSKDRTKPFKCRYCSYKQASSKEMERHLEIHNDMNKYACNKCSFKTAWRKSLKMHVIKHEGLKLFDCTICDFRCNDRSNLSVHVKSHKTQYDEICRVCGSKFRLKQHLLNHLKTHNKVQQYRCDVCVYTTYSLSHFSSHKYKHTMDRRHQCPKCDMCFSRSNVLKNHLFKIHRDGEELFSCQMCEYVGRNKQGLNSHMKKHKSKTAQHPSVSVQTRQSGKFTKVNEHVNFMKFPIESSSACRDLGNIRDIELNDVESELGQRVCIDLGQGSNIGHDVSQCVVSNRDDCETSEIGALYHRKVRNTEENRRKSKVGQTKQLGDTKVGQTKLLGGNKVGQTKQLDDSKVRQTKQLGDRKVGQTKQLGDCKVGQTKQSGDTKVGQITDEDQIESRPFDTQNQLNYLASGSCQDNSVDFLSRENGSESPTNIDLQVIIGMEADI